MGNCLAGDTCVFSHDPTKLLADLNLNTPLNEAGTARPTLQIQDYNAFPALQPNNTNSWAISQGNGLAISSISPGMVARNLSNISFSSLQTGMASTTSARSFSSRPTSRHSSRAATPSIPQVDDTEAFPSLGSLISGKSGKKHHGKRGGHGHTNTSKDGFSSLLADVVRINSTPNTPTTSLRKGLMKSRSYAGRQETDTGVNTIPAPEHIPWLESGEYANLAYLKARQDAFKHGGLRNKFLQRFAVRPQTYSAR